MRQEQCAPGSIPGAWEGSLGSIWPPLQTARPAGGRKRPTDCTLDLTALKFDFQDDAESHPAPPRPGTGGTSPQPVQLLMSQPGRTILFAQRVLGYHLSAVTQNLPTPSAWPVSQLLLGVGATLGGVEARLQCQWQ